jgi:hypothetical protein
MYSEFEGKNDCSSTQHMHSVYVLCFFLKSLG